MAGKELGRKEITSEYRELHCLHGEEKSMGGKDVNSSVHNSQSTERIRRKLLDYEVFF